MVVEGSAAIRWYEAVDVTILDLAVPWHYDRPMATTVGCKYSGDNNALYNVQISMVTSVLRKAVYFHCLLEGHTPTTTSFLNLDIYHNIILKKSLWCAGYFDMQGCCDTATQDGMSHTVNYNQEESYAEVSGPSAVTVVTMVE